MYLTLSYYISKLVQVDPTWIDKLPEAKSTKSFCNILGTLLDYVRKGNMCRAHMSTGTPDILRFRTGILSKIVPTFVLTKDINLVRQILNDPHVAKPESSYRVFKRLHGYEGGNDFLSAESHKQAFYLRNRMMTYRTLMESARNKYESTMCVAVDNFLDSLTGNQCWNTCDIFHQIAITLITQIGFGETNANLDRDLFESAVWLVEDTITHPERVFYPLLDKLPLPSNATLWQKQKQLRTAIYGLIKRKRKEYNERTDDSETDVVQELIKNPNNTDQDLLGILAVFFFAGFDTTANTMTMVLYHLAKYPEVQEKARKEALHHGQLKWNNVFNMTYLLAVLNEVLRLYPTVPTVSRNIRASSGLVPRHNESSTFGININMFGVHRQCENPNDFIPERWLTPDQKLCESFMPFAIGKRSCLGKQFAIVEMLTTIHKMLLRFRFSIPATKLNVEPTFSEFGTLMLDEKSYMVNVEPFEHVNDKHSTTDHPAAAENIIIRVNGKLYDITNINHPGGNAIFELFRGTVKDASDHYNGFLHSKKAHTVLEQYKIEHSEQ